MRQFLLAIVVCFMTAVAARPQSVTSDNVERAKPAVNVQEIPGAPLRISVETKWATPDQQMLEVYFTVKNIGGNPIRAYTVRVSHGTEAQESAGCFLNNIEKAGKLLQPNQSVGRSTWRPISPSDPQSTIELTLDFVEFTDGSVWGGNSCQSAERLSGLRAGARVAKLRFKKKLNERGISALLKQLYEDDPELAPPAAKGVVTADLRGQQPGLS